jgi:Protein of unknown function (DUF1569)
MKNVLNPINRQALIARLKTMQPDSRKNWGSMTVYEVIPHMTEPLRLAIGEKNVPHQKSIFYDSLFGKGIVWVLPWPKGAPTAKEFLPGKGCTAPTTFNADMVKLLEALEWFAKFSEAQEFHASPVFGKLSKKAWGRLMWRHIDHHLRQFSA